MGDFAEVIDEQTIRFVRVLPGPIERVWDYLYDGKKRGEWFASGDMPSKAGETFKMFFKHSTLSPNAGTPPDKYKDMDKTGFFSSNKLLTLEPPRRLVFEFDSTDPNSSIVEFVLTSEPGDKVRFTITHSNIANRQHALGFAGGWHSHLAILQHKTEGRTPPSFWDLWRENQTVYEKRYA